MKPTIAIIALGILAGCNGNPNNLRSVPDVEHPIVTQCRFRAAVANDWLTEIRLTRQCVEFWHQTGQLP